MQQTDPQWNRVPGSACPCTLGQGPSKWQNLAAKLGQWGHCRARLRPACTPGARRGGLQLTDLKQAEQ